MISKFANLQQAKNLSLLLRRATFATAPQTGNAAQNLENAFPQDKVVRDEKYEELAIKFQRQWKKYTEESTAQEVNPLASELSDVQKQRVELLATAFLELNMYELRYFGNQFRERVHKNTGISPFNLNMDWATVQQRDIGNWPPANPNWFLQQEAIAKLWPAGQQGFAQLFGGNAMGGGGAGGAPQQAAAAAPKEEVKKEEKVVEKTIFDIELAGIDAAKKISIIKEVREILKLGLKEAKEMVEKAPVVLKREVKKEEAELLKEKLGAAGCTINLL